MSIEIKLKNSSEYVLLDENTYNKLLSDPTVLELDLLNNLRKHSSGCAVFQKTVRESYGEYSTQTIYFHRFIAEKFLSEQKSNSNNLVGAKNANKLDCRLDNLIWRSRSTASRLRKTSSRTGYTGVYMENKKYRAIISIQGKAVHLGMFDTPEAAALAYNKKSKELFGEKAKINQIGMN
jgi:tRNA splicing ligase